MPNNGQSISKNKTEEKPIDAGQAQRKSSQQVNNNDSDCKIVPLNECTACNGGFLRFQRLLAPGEKRVCADCKRLMELAKEKVESDPRVRQLDALMEAVEDLRHPWRPTKGDEQKKDEEKIAKQKQTGADKDKKDKQKEENDSELF